MLWAAASKFCHRNLNLCDVRFVVLADRLIEVQVDFADWSINLEAVGRNPLQNYLIALIQRVVCAVVNHACYFDRR
jgi:hypothetical protein